MKNRVFKDIQIQTHQPQIGTRTKDEQGKKL